MNVLLFMASHARLAQIGWVFMLLLAIWAGYHFFSKKPLPHVYLKFILAAEIFMIIQGSIGVFMFWGIGLRPGQLQHLLYGFLLVGSLPVAYRYTQQSDDPIRVAKVWMLVCLFMFGLVMRATMTGPVGG